MFGLMNKVELIEQVFVHSYTVFLRYKNSQIAALRESVR